MDISGFSGNSIMFNDRLITKHAEAATATNLGDKKLKYLL